MHASGIASAAVSAAGDSSDAAPCEVTVSIDLDSLEHSVAVVHDVEADNSEKNQDKVAQSQPQRALGKDQKAYSVSVKLFTMGMEVKPQFSVQVRHSLPAVVVSVVHVLYYDAVRGL